jgi:hypothetical protein
MKDLLLSRPKLLLASLAGLTLAACAATLYGTDPAPAAPLDPALALIAEAQMQLQKVQDYTCTVRKQERVRGELLPEQILTMKVRNQPFGVNLYWQAPRSLQGQEVCYVAGQNRGMMRVHPVGIKGIFGFVSVDPNDPRAFKDNRHPVTSAGLGFLIDGCARQWELERRWNKTVVRIAEAEFDGRPCTWVETVHPDMSAGSFYACRCLLCLDKATHLPVHSSAYDAQGQLLESYSYLDIHLNVGLTDDAFNR